MHHQSLELDLSNGPGDEGSAFYSMHENEIDYSDHAAPLSIAEDAGVLMMPPAQRRRHSNGRDGVSGGLPSDPPVDPELAKLTEMTEDSQTHEGGEPVGVESLDTEMNEEGGECEEVDHRSIYVGNVDYGATPQELQDHFKTCGTVNRVTIMVDKFSGHPKGYAYIEFADAEAVSNAVVLDDTTFRGRQIKVKSKRTNIPGFNSMRGRGRGFRGRGRGRGFGRGYMRGPFMGYGPRFRGRGAKRGVAPY